MEYKCDACPLSDKWSHGPRVSIKASEDSGIHKSGCCLMNKGVMPRIQGGGPYKIMIIQGLVRSTIEAPRPRR